MYLSCERLFKLAGLVEDRFAVGKGGAIALASQWNNGGAVFCIVFLIAWMLCAAVSEPKVISMKDYPFVLERVILLLRVIVRNDEWMMKDVSMAVPVASGNGPRGFHSGASSRNSGAHQRRKDRMSPRFLFVAEHFLCFFLLHIFDVTTIHYITVVTSAYTICFLFFSRDLASRCLVILYFFSMGYYRSIYSYYLTPQIIGKGSGIYLLFSRYGLSLSLTLLLTELEIFQQQRSAAVVRIAHHFDAIEKSILGSTVKEGRESVQGVIDYLSYVGLNFTIPLCLWFFVTLLEESLDVSCAGIVGTVISVVVVAGGSWKKDMLRALGVSFLCLMCNVTVAILAYCFLPADSLFVIAKTVPAALTVVFIANNVPSGCSSSMLLTILWVIMVGFAISLQSSMYVVGEYYPWLNQALHANTVAFGFLIFLSSAFPVPKCGSHFCELPKPATKTSNVTTKQPPSANKGEHKQKEKVSRAPPTALVHKLPLFPPTIKVRNNASNEDVLFTVPCICPPDAVVDGVKEGSYEQSVENFPTTCEEGDIVVGVVCEPTSWDGRDCLHRVMDNGPATDRPENFLVQEWTTTNSTSDHGEGFSVSCVVEAQVEVGTMTEMERSETEEDSAPKGESATEEEKDTSNDATCVPQTVKDDTAAMDGAADSSPVIPPVQPGKKPKSQQAASVAPKQKGKAPMEAGTVAGVPQNPRKKQSGVDSDAPSIAKASSQTAVALEGSTKKCSVVAACERTPVGGVVKVLPQNHPAPSQQDARKEVNIPLPRRMVKVQVETNEENPQAEKLAREPLPQPEISPCDKPKGNEAENAKKENAKKRRRRSRKKENRKNESSGSDGGNGENGHETPEKSDQKRRNDSKSKKSKKEEKQRSNGGDGNRSNSKTEKKKAEGKGTKGSNRNNENKNKGKTSNKSDLSTGPRSDSVKDSGKLSENRDGVSITIPQPRSWSTTPQGPLLPRNFTSLDDVITKPASWFLSDSVGICESENDVGSVSATNTKTHFRVNSFSSLGESHFSEVSHLNLNTISIKEATQLDGVRTIPPDALNALENFAKVWEVREDVPRGSGGNGSSKSPTKIKQRNTPASSWTVSDSSVEPTRLRVPYQVGNGIAVSQNFSTLVEKDIKLAEGGTGAFSDHRNHATSTVERNVNSFYGYQAPQNEFLMMTDRQMAMCPMYAPHYAVQQRGLFPSMQGGMAALQQSSQQQQQHVVIYPQIAVPVSQVHHRVWQH
uniref:Uncharacterized protein TCIL3000_10_8330 n=1 Tax=Trypanosoma congolense (strain IL3000) TaxID=1068625 RepID=G0UXE0_TRYCI|nr:unnamed protein product [Trypanosoma congolense IL3000]